MREVRRPDGPFGAVARPALRCAAGPLQARRRRRHRRAATSSIWRTARAASRSSTAPTPARRGCASSSTASRCGFTPTRSCSSGSSATCWRMRSASPVRATITVRARARRARRAHQRERHRLRHPARRAGAHVRGVLPAAQCRARPLARPRPRPVDRAAPGRHARLPHRARVEARPGQQLHGHAARRAGRAQAAGPAQAAAPPADVAACDVPCCARGRRRGAHGDGAALRAGAASR